MSVGTLPRTVKPPAVVKGPVRFTVKQYHTIQDSGALSGMCGYELIRDQIVEKDVPKPIHVKTVRKLKNQIERLLGTEYAIRVQDPVMLPDGEPEPDLAMVDSPLDRYDERHPLPKDISLIVEVSFSTLFTDRTQKYGMYAEAGVPVYWIVNLVEGIVEVYTQPRGSKYRKRTDYIAGQSVPVTIARKTLGSIPVQEFLP